MDAEPPLMLKTPLQKSPAPDAGAVGAPSAGRAAMAAATSDHRERVLDYALSTAMQSSAQTVS